MISAPLHRRRGCKSPGWGGAHQAPGVVRLTSRTENTAGAAAAPVRVPPLAGAAVRLHGFLLDCYARFRCSRLPTWPDQMIDLDSAVCLYKDMTVNESGQIPDSSQERRPFLEGLTAISGLSLALYLTAYSYWDAFYGGLDMTVEQAGGDQVTASLRLGIGIALTAGTVLLAIVILASMFSVYATGWVYQQTSGHSPKLLARVFHMPAALAAQVVSTTRVASRLFFILLVPLIFVPAWIAWHVTFGEAALFSLGIAFSAWLLSGFPRSALIAILIALCAFNGVLAGSSFGEDAARSVRAKGVYPVQNFFLGLRISWGTLVTSPESSPLFTGKEIPYVLLATNDEVYTVVDMCKQTVLRVPMGDLVFTEAAFGAINVEDYCTEYKHSLADEVEEMKR